MNCPYYVDFTRNCLKKYPAIIQYKDYSKCESNGHKKCVIYNILSSDFRCKYLDSCLNMFPDDLPEFFKLLNHDEATYNFVTEPTYHFCLSKENYVQCARYKIKETGQHPPPGLSPDGKNVNIADSIFKRKTTLEKSK